METSWLARLAGRFIVFDGPDGSGKSTQLKRFVGACQAAGLSMCEVREPGGTPVGERIRAILLDRQLDGVTLRCEMLLYMASRVQLVETRIRPALEAGQVVIADRFVSSTLAYQGAAGGLPEAEIRAVASVAVGMTWPDLVVIFDVAPEVAARRTKGVERQGKRTAAAGSSLFDDRIEQRGNGYQAKVREGFLAQAAADPAHHLVIDGGRDEDEVWKSLLAGLKAWLGG